MHLLAVDHLLSGKYGVGRAAIDTFGAGAAIIFRKRIIVFQFKIDNKGSNKKELTPLFIDQVTIFPDPAKPVSLCPAAFQYRRLVNEIHDHVLHRWFNYHFRYKECQFCF